MTARQDKEGRWFYRTMHQGRRVYGTPRAFGLPNSKSGAVEAERRAIARAMAGEPIKPTESILPAPPPPKEVHTIESFAPTFLAVSGVANKPSSVNSKEQVLRDHLKPHIGPLALERVDYATIEDLKVTLRGKLSAKSVNNVLTVLRRMLAIAKKRKLIESVPEIEWLRVPKSQFDFLTFDELRRLVTAADGEWTTMVLLAARTGLRQGELLALRWEDCDLVAGRLMVRQAVARGIVGTPKSGKDREVPLSPETVARLKSHRHLRGPLVFCDAAGHMLTRGECKHPLYRACKRAGLRRIGWHVLRHTFASHLAMRGVSPKAIQELGGWASLSMVLRYAHLTPEVRRDAVALLDGQPNGRDLAEKLENAESGR